MSKVAIVTDSTSTIPKDRIEKLNITVAPQVVIWSGKTYRDGIEISAGDFHGDAIEEVEEGTNDPNDHNRV